MTLLKFLSGAPDWGSLKWQEGDLLNDFVPAVRRHLDDVLAQEALEDGAVSSTVPNSIPKWRSIEVDYLSKEQSAIDEIPDSEERCEEHRNPGGAAEFLEHSLAVFEGLDKQAPENNHPNDADTTVEDTTFCSESVSFMTGGSGGLLDDHSNIEYSHLAFDQRVQLPSQIDDLCQLPSPSHIQAIHPQTITASLIAGVISVSPLRTVQLKRFQRNMEILEILAGDETRVAFSITLWLAPTAGVNKDEALRDVAMMLRPQDIVCVQDIALNVFRGRVYGQSLSRRIGRVQTRVQILGRSGQVIWHQLDRKERTELVDKLKRVEKWARYFLCSSATTRSVKENDRVQRVRPDLPPDTQ